MTNERHENDFEGAVGMQEVLYWIKELKNPCFPPGQPDLHVGDTYLREAKKLLKRLEATTNGARNEDAIALLKQAIDEYEVTNRNRFK